MSSNVKNFEDQFEKKCLEVNDIYYEIAKVVDCLKTWELSLGDVVAMEDKLKTLCEDLRDGVSDIVHLRMWIDFERLGESLR